MRKFRLFTKNKCGIFYESIDADIFGNSGQLVIALLFPLWNFFSKIEVESFQLSEIDLSGSVLVVGYFLAGFGLD